MVFENQPKSRKNNLIVQDLANETLVYDLKTNQAFCLNKTSALVWQFCDGKSSVAKISNLMSKKLQTLVSEDFVWLALNELERNNLLEIDAKIQNNFATVNRREIIKKVGLASMIALPMISSVIAPTAANAASGCIAGVTFPVPPGGNPPNVFANVIPFPIADNTTGCGQCLNLLNPQCCSGSVVNFSCSPAFPAASYNCNALCA